MGALDNLYVSSSFQGLLKMADSTNGLTNTLQSVQTGDGDNSPLQMSTTQINISGSLFVNGVQITGSTSGTSGTSGSNGSSGTAGSSGTSGSSGSGFTYNGVWDNAVNYNVNDVVLYNGQTYVAIQANVNKQPSVQPAFWQVFSAAGSSGTSGTSGSNGSNGSSGTSGATGSSGTSGTSGSDGLVGSNGTSGTSGSNGTDGSSGTSGVVDYTGLITTGSLSSIGVTGSTQSISGGFNDVTNVSVNIPSLFIEGLTVNGFQKIQPTLDVSGSVINPFLEVGDPNTGSQFPYIGLYVDSTGPYGNFASITAVDKGNNNTVGFAQTTFNTVDNRIAGAYYGFGTGNNNADNTIMMTYSGDTNLHITRNTILTGSLNILGATTVNELIVSGALIGNAANKGLIKIKTEAYESGTLQFENYISASSPVSQSNLVFGSATPAPITATGSFIISGSNNIIFQSIRTNTLGQGTLGYLAGNSNILYQIPLISTSSFLNQSNFSNNNNVINSTVTLDSFASGAIPSNVDFNTFSSNNIGSPILLRHKSGSFSMSNNNLQGQIQSFATQSILFPSGAVAGPSIQGNVHAGSVTTLSHISSSIVYQQNISDASQLLIRNSATHPAALNGSGSVTVSNNIFGGGTNTLNFSGPGAQASKGVNNNIVVGNSNELNMISSGSNAFLTNTAILGFGLIVSGSNGGTGDGGSTFIGRWNATGSNQESTSQTVFAIGNGGNAGSRRNALRVDSAGNSQFTGSVQISGSLIVNGNTITPTDRNGLITTGSIGASQRITGSLNINDGSFSATRQNLGEYLSFTGSRFTPTVLTSTDLENINQNQFVFNQLHLGDSLTGTQLKLNTNKASNFTEVALNARYSGQSDSFISVENNNTGASICKINARTVQIQNGTLNVQNGITGSLQGNADTSTTASFALNANFSRVGLITTGSISTSQQITGQLRISGSDTQPLQIGAGDSTAKIAVLNSSNPFLYHNTSNYSTIIGNVEGSNNGFAAGSEKNMIFNGFYLAFNSGSQNTVISGGGGNFRSGSSNVMIGTPGVLEYGNNNTYIGTGAPTAIESDTIRISRNGLGVDLFKKSGLDPLQINGDVQITGSLLVSNLTNATGSFVVTTDSTGTLTKSPYSAVTSNLFSVGDFYSTQTQTLAGGVSGSVTYNNTGTTYGVSLVSGSQLTIANAGVYNIQFSAQILSDSGADDVWFWLKKNGTNIADTAGRVTLANNDELMAAWNYLVSANAGDYYELVWQNLNGHAELLYNASSGNIPSVPSIIITVTQVR